MKINNKYLNKSIFDMTDEELMDLTGCKGWHTGGSIDAHIFLTNAGLNGSEIFLFNDITDEMLQSLNIVINHELNINKKDKPCV